MQSNQVNLDEALAASLLYDHPEWTIDDGVTTLQLQQEEDYKEAWRISLAADEELAKELQDMEDHHHPQISLSDDENYAKLLQDEEYMTNPVALTDDVNQVTNQFQDLEVNRSSSLHRESSIGSSSQSVQPLPPNDDIDPENMSYEELNQLGESMGKVSKGLSKKKIDKLPTYKLGESSSWFKKKIDVSENTQCSICLIELEQGDTVTVLPCGHIYHKDCISHWLEDNKICCVCTAEVRP